MSVEITGRYLGGLKIESVHGPSKARLLTADPVDNKGDGSSFSPTDLLATALGTCMLTLIAIVGERDGLDLSGMEYRAVKEMAATPRRVGQVPLEIRLPSSLTPQQRKRLETAALTCPVKMSLPEELETPVRFLYEL